jgi:hypothetical protein
MRENLTKELTIESFAEYPDKMNNNLTKPLIDSGEWEIYIGGPIT